MTSPDLNQLLTQLFDAERKVRSCHDDLVVADPKALLPAIEAQVKVALGDDLGEEEKNLRLVRLASVLGELEGPRVVDLLIDILGSEEPEPRHAAGEALEEMAYERFKEVALGVERALDRLPVGNAALVELPYLLAEVPEGGVLKLLQRFLASKDPEAAAAAIEAVVQYGDPAAASLLAALENDKRQVAIEDDGGDEGKVTLGELATDARQLLATLKDKS
jgi:HEAT repeat protein